MRAPGPLALTAAALIVLSGPARERGDAAAQTGGSPAEVTRTLVVGHSLQGRPIVVYRRFFPGARRRLLVIGNVHGSEPAGLRVAARLRNAVPPPDVDLWILPTANPDGVAHGTRTNAAGVDLNRNFPYQWRRANIGRGTYTGPGPLSEPESRALLGLVQLINPRLTVTFHQPLDGVGRNVKRNDVVVALAAGLHLPVKEFSCTGICYGSFTSWFNRTRPGVAVTVEFPRHPPDWQIAAASRTVLSVAARY